MKRIFKKKIIKNCDRILIYFSLVILLVFSIFIIHSDFTKAQELSEHSAKIIALNETVVDWRELVQKKNQAQKNGVDTTTIEIILDQVYHILFEIRDCEQANILIYEANKKLDQIVSDFEAEKLAAELRKGDLTGHISCSQVNCPVKIMIKLQNANGVIADIEADAEGNYKFHQDADTYSLVVIASGYQTVFRSNVNIVGQQQIIINLDLIKNPISSKNNVNNGNVDNKNEENSDTGGETPANFSPAIIAVFNLINDYRQTSGLSVLSLSGSISAAADGHSNWMAASNILSHIGEGDSMPWDRCSKVGTSCSSEIIYKGSASAASAFESWKNSSPHNAIMLGNFSSIGIGVSGIYWTADFR
jgi:uncharacterized protein YkwD